MTGLNVEETIEREPYAPDVEYQSRRAYVFARKPRHVWARRLLLCSWRNATGIACFRENPVFRI